MLSGWWIRARFPATGAALPVMVLLLLSASGCDSGGDPGMARPSRPAAVSPLPAAEPGASPSPPGDAAGANPPGSQGTAGGAHPERTPAASSAARQPSPRPLTDEQRALLDEFEQIAADIEKTNALFIGGSRLVELKQRLEDAEPGSREASRAYVLLGREQLRLGDSLDAMASFQLALRVLEDRWNLQTASGVVAADSAAQRAARAEALFRIMIAGMRVGEQANCVARHQPASCILPIREGGVHAEKQGAETAMSYALQYLSMAPRDLRAVWFLNLAAMQAGVYPEGVAERFRIPPERFTSKVPFKPYENIAARLGIDTFDQAGGSVMDDLDGDGDIDILTSTMDPRGSLRLWINDGQGGFTDGTVAAGLHVQLGGLNVMQTDHDNDGDLDLLVLRGGWLQAQGRIRNSLLRNDGRGGFTDVTRAAGLHEPALPTQAAAWADYDGDGDLDVYIGNEGETGNDGETSFHPNNLFRNNGDGTFTDVAAEAGVAGEGYTKGVAWGDHDGDGDPDLYVSNIGPNNLYRNNGDGTFTDVAGELGVTEPASKSFAAWFFDHDNDGDLDLFVTAYNTEIADVAADIMQLDGRNPAQWPRLYRNDGNKGFSDITIEAGLDHPSQPMGANFADIDGDGFLDIYLGTGAPAYQALMPNVMLLNGGDGTFADVTFAGGFGHLQKGHGVAFGDIDGDGDLDLSLQAGGFFPGDRFSNALFENPGHGNRFVAVKVEGTRSNRPGIGTRLHVRVRTPAGERSIYRQVTSGGSFGASSLTQTIGLGDATEILFIEATWPASGLTTRLDDVPLDGSVILGEEGHRPPS